MGPGDLRVIMAGLPKPDDPAVVVGTETSDDAGVYRLSVDTAIVCTADFITPPVDDAYLFGQIAAANSLSDVYAMGGQPLACLALCMFPKALEPDVARQILAGGQDKVHEAGAVVIGGHTVRGEELLYGLSVTGRVDPARVVRNVGVRPGDALVLTKPLGSGLVINGLRKGAVSDEDALPVLRELAVLNAAAARVMCGNLPHVHAATDVTGFGLVGHALAMAAGSHVGLSILLARLPIYEPARAMVEKGVTTGSTKPNRANGADRVRWARPPEKFWDELVHDPQTSGGLLIAVDAAHADAFVDELHAAGVPHAVRIGSAVAADLPQLELT